MRAVRSAFYGALVLLAGATAAAFAHVVIDVAGDFVLVRDAYDGLAHESRAVFAAIALALAALVAIRYLWEAIDRRSGSLVGLVRQLRVARGPSAWKFVAAVVIVTVAGLVAMETMDGVLAGTRVDDLSDLFGGSVALGAGIAVLCGAAVAVAIRAFLGFVAGWEPAIAAFVARLLARFETMPRAYDGRYAFAAATVGRRIQFRRCTAKRGPPIPALV